MSTVFFFISIFAFIAIVVLAFVGMARSKPSPDTRPWQAKTRFWVLGAACVWAVALIAAAAIPHSVSTASDEAEGVAQSSSDRYEQTWNKGYSDTNCGDWSVRMTEQQRFAAAADMLAATWGKVEKSSRFPSDALIREFQDGIDTSCVADSLDIAGVAVMLYQSEPRFRP
ncbi:Trk-type K+ transport system membrane component [Microbacterium resistens]|uniref:Trk-type K+ transport system membrane component n=1 Tax=Microbacterium resistens TaxID=156977 RepID=A0ABU1SH67_9MICO|nr:hypothetical protein [Microbacterium resistens]MDR6868935.1 Trk-type K+ transport system membrane component [Microbacterium resistens]